jgi:Na+/H+ antiporter NhaC
MDFLVLLPPLLAIGLALWTREVYLSLFAGLWVGATLLAGGNPILGLRELGDQLVAVFADAGNTRVVFFCVLVGSLIALVQASGGVEGFIRWAQARGWGTTRRGAELLAWTIGMVIFVESSITSLTVGAVSRSFFEKLRLPREKLAYYCDATSAPVCMMLPLNGWGAYILGLLAAQGISDSMGVRLLASSLIFNFYSWFTILFSLLLAITGWRFGAMRRAEERAAASGLTIREGGRPMMADEVAGLAPVPNAPFHLRDLAIPILTMVAMIFVGLWITGDGDLMGGSGSTAVLWAVSFGIGAAMLVYSIPRNGKRVMTPIEATGLILKGASGLLPVTILIVFAFALGQVSRELEMGPYLVGLIGAGGPAWWLPSAIFIVGCLISFTLGSSWSAFAIMIPIALPLADGLGVSPALMLGAVLAGGVFGDHASPLSDTSIISSMAAASDHIDHVNTQLPYALLVAVLSLAAFVAAGLLT